MIEKEIVFNMSRKSFEIQEAMDRIFRRDDYYCQRCGSRENLQTAHRIAKGKDNRKMIKNLLRSKGIYLNNKEIDDIIHHPLNLVTSCDKCNSYFNIGNDRIKSLELINEIYCDIEKRLFENSEIT